MPPSPPQLTGWTRPRIIFLSLWALVTVLVIALARDVILPFILAAVIAFVLKPLVERLEKRGLSRVVAILSTYLISALVLAVSVSLIAPRLYDEAVSMSREAPRMARKAAEEWAPAVDGKIQQFFGSVGEAPKKESKPAVILRKQADGSSTLELGSGAKIVDDGSGGWRLISVGEEERLSLQDLVEDGLHSGLDYMKHHVLDVIRLGQVVVSSVTRAIFMSFMTLMVAGYLMYTREGIAHFFRGLVPPRHRVSYEQLIRRMDKGLSGVVRGQLIICLVNGVLSAIGFAILGLKYWHLLALLAGIMSLIPIFGSILSTIPAVLVGLTQDVWIAFWVLIWILGIHQVEANFLNPKIIGDAAKLHPVMVVFVLMVGEHYLGLWGALLAVPCLSIVQSLFHHFRFQAMPDLPPDTLVLENSALLAANMALQATYGGATAAPSEASETTDTAGSQSKESTENIAGKDSEE